MANAKTPPKKKPVVRLAPSTAVVRPPRPVGVTRVQVKPTPATPVPKPNVQAMTVKMRREAALALRKQRARALVLLRQIGARKARIARDFWLIGDALREILRDKLYVALGHQSFEELLEKREVVALTTAKKLILIAEQVPRAQALALGQEKAHELVKYTEWTEAEDTVAELVKNDARIGGKPVSAATATEVKVATQKLRETRKPLTGPEKLQAARQKSADTKLRAFLKAHGLPSPNLTRRARTWVLRLSVEDIDALA